MLYAKTRRGKKSRRQLEFNVVRDQIVRRSQAFYARLLRNLQQVGDCIVYGGALSKNGYAYVTFRYKGQHVTIHAHRLFLILRLGTPIPVGIDAGHEFGCPHRHCVKHVFAQPFVDNAVTDPKGANFGEL